MSVQTQIDRISGAVSAALTALSEKGVTVPTGTKVDDLAALISGIEAGGSGGGGLCTSGTLTIANDSTYVYIPHEALAYEGSVYPKIAFICPIIRKKQVNISTNFGGCVIARFEDNTPLLTSKYANLPGDYFQYGKLNVKYYTPLYMSSTKVSYELGMLANSANFGGTLWSAGTEFFYGCIW